MERTDDIADDDAGGWALLTELLALIRTLFGDALKAAAGLAPRVAESAARWVRAAEALARVLVLARAWALPALMNAQARRLPRAKRPGSRPLRGLFALMRRRRRVRRLPREMSRAAFEAWHYFGGKEAAAEARALRRATGLAPSFQQRPATAPSGVVVLPAGHGVATPPSAVNLVRRFNRLVGVLEAPDRVARTLRRRLGAAPRLAARVLAAAAPRTRWRTGHDDRIVAHAQALKRRAPPDTS